MTECEKTKETKKESDEHDDVRSSSVAEDSDHETLSTFLRPCSGTENHLRLFYEANITVPLPSGEDAKVMLDILDKGKWKQPHERDGLFHKRNSDILYLCEADRSAVICGPVPSGSSDELGVSESSKSFSSSSISLALDSGSIRDSLFIRFASFLDVLKAAGMATRDKTNLYKNCSDGFDDFRDIAVHYGPVFIHEYSVPYDKKTLKPKRDIQQEEGTAGGQKVCCFECLRIKNPIVLKEGILQQYYNGMIYKAQKSPKHEFIGTDTFFECALQSQAKEGEIVVIPPPCLLVDYLGHRVLVSLHLPLGPRVYGKSGDEKYKKPDYVKECGAIQRVDDMLSSLGLKQHSLKIVDPSHVCRLPFDCEMFKCEASSDGKLFFVVDLARLMPACKKDGRLFKFFRKEFVKYYFLKTGKSLSNDAFNPNARNEDNNEVTRAYQYYNDNVPGLVIDHLRRVDCGVFSQDLVIIMHFHGLNLRDTALVYEELDPENVEDAKWMSRIKIEVLARSIRRVIDHVLYNRVNQGKVILSEIKEVITDILRYIIGSPADINVWTAINKWKELCFPGLDFELEQDILFPSWSENYLLKDFFAILGDLLGITWDTQLWIKLNDEEFFKDIKNNLLSIIDIKDLHPRILELNIANHSRGVVYMGNKHCARRNYKESVNYLRLALIRQPTNGHTIIRYCQACEKLALELQKMGRTKEAEELLKKSEHWTEEACNLPYPLTNILFAGGLLYMKRAHEVFSKLYAGELKEMKDHQKTGLYKELIKKGLETSKEMKENLEKARDHFLKAWEKDNDHPHVGFMLADVMILLGSDVKDVMKYLTGTGNNGLYHRLCYLLQTEEWEENWEEAAEIALKLEESSDFEESDLEILDFIDHFHEEVQKRSH